MLLRNALKKVKKEFNLEPNVNGKFHSITYNGKILEFLKTSDDEIQCISTCNVNDKPDSQSDYFPQTWHDNLTQAIKFLKRN